ncbi:unnamed protein product, partial [Prorocentrum cordatum]
ALPGAVAAAAVAAGPPLPPGLPAPAGGSAAAAPPSAPGLGLDDDGTGLTQAAVHLSLNASDIDVDIDEAAVAPGAAVAAAPAAPPAAPPAMLDTQLVSDFAEQEILQHFALVQAVHNAEPTQRGVPVTLPRSWQDMQGLLRKLAYDPGTADPWRRLGMAMYEGPEPTASSIAARAWSAQLLLGLAQHAGWPASDMQNVNEFVLAVNAAEARCLEELGPLLRERRKLKASKLPLQRELGPVALAFVRSLAVLPGEQVYTQWSDILGTLGDLSAAPAQVVREARELATLAEKGDDVRLWTSLAGRAAVLWAPEQTNALTRCLKGLLRMPPEGRPTSVRLVTTIPLMPGMSTPAGVMDLWWHPLLGDTWAPLVREITFSATPMEVILPGTGGPRHVRTGLAVFTLRHLGERALPKMVNPVAPLLTLIEARTVIFDTQATHLPRLLNCLLGLQGVICQDHSRSALSTKERPRVQLEALFPSDMADLQVLLRLQALRRTDLPADTFFGLISIFAAGDSQILETTSGANIHHYWRLCSQMVS